MPGVSKQARVRELLNEARALSGDFDALSEAVAARVGLNQSDLLALDLISREGGLAAGQLAERLHLTTGAITGVIDRLAKAGFARRADDPRDRRRVMVVPTPNEARIGQLYGALSTSMRALANRYTTEELELLTGFVREMRKVVGGSIDGLTAGR